MDNKSRGLFRRFFGFIGNTLLSLFKGIARLLISITVLGVIAFILIAVLNRPDNIPSGVALIIAPKGTIVEQLAVSPSLTSLISGGLSQETLLRDLTSSIDAAAKDERINSLVLKLDGLSGSGLSKLEEVGQSLQRFQKSGKTIVATGNNFSQSQYYLASYADQILLNPFGAVEVTGFSRYQSYYKDALDKLKINVHVFKVGSFKDAVEPFLVNRMSDASRLHNSEWVNALWDSYTSRVETLRELPKGAIDDYINTIETELEKRAGDTAQLALDSGLVDQLATRQQITSALIAIAGYNGNDSYKQVGMSRYLQDVQAQQVANDMFKKNKIAVVIASGEIYDGNQPRGSIGGDSLARLLSQVQRDPDVKAVVLRVDSPGGSAYASEVIRQEILQLKNKGIPVVISMSSLAASGGYWISADADQIWASPSTLTGSIGVFGIIPTLEQSLAELGITSDGVATSELADFGSLTRPMSDKAARVYQSAIDGIYQKFLALVAAGRNSTSDDIHKVAQGRVWTGARAQQLGLVDHLGGLQQAIAAAEKLSGIESYKIEYVEQPLSFEDTLIMELSKNASISSWLGISNIIPESLQKVASPLLKALNELNDPKGYYLRCYDCEVQ